VQRYGIKNQEKRGKNQDLGFTIKLDQNKKSTLKKRMDLNIYCFALSAISHEKKLPN